MNKTEATKAETFKEKRGMKTRVEREKERERGEPAVSSPPTQLLVHKRLLLFSLTKKTAQQSCANVSKLSGMILFSFCGEGSPNAFSRAKKVLTCNSRWRYVKVTSALFFCFFKKLSRESKNRRLLISTLQ